MTGKGAPQPRKQHSARGFHTASKLLNGNTHDPPMDLLIVQGSPPGETADASPIKSTSSATEPISTAAVLFLSVSLSLLPASNHGVASTVVCLGTTFASIM